jgi:hypothetical protein
MIRGSDLHGETCGACAAVCDRCADECDRHGEDPGRQGKRSWWKALKRCGKNILMTT